MTRLVLTLACADRPGIVHTVTGAILEWGGNVVESAQFHDPDTGRFFMRVAFEGAGTRGGFEAALAPLAAGFGGEASVHDAARRMRTLLLVSRTGHCLNDLLYRARIGALPAQLVGVASNHEDWRARTEAEGLPFWHLPISAATKPEQEARLAALIEAERVELVVLARYMQVLSDGLARSLAGRVVNIHHAFLPSFKGARPYHRAHARGVKMIGATAHYVTPDLDEGPIIEQGVIRVHHGMSPEQLVAAGRDVEASVLARAVALHAENRVLLNGERTVVFG